MFQLNKKKLLITIIILLLIFTFVTFYLIYKENNKDFVLDYEKTNKKEIDTKYSVDFNGKYNTNDLEIITKEYDNEHNDVYVSINGLKDTKYQDKVNSDILKLFKSLINKDMFTYCSAYANYSNVLSIECENYNNDVDKHYSLNYNLKDQKELDFKELFLDNVDIESIIAKSYYNNKIIYDKKSSPDDMIRVLLNEYNKGNYLYYFNSDTIFLVIKDEMIEISMKEYYKYIAIFDRYKDSKNIYKNSIGYKNIMPISIDGVYVSDSNNLKVGYQNDYFYCFYSYLTLDDFLKENEESKLNNKVLKEVYNVYKDRVNTLFNEYKSKDKGVMLYGEVTIDESSLKTYEYEVNTIFNINPYLYVYECNKNTFKDKFVPYFILSENTYDNYLKDLENMGVSTNEVDDDSYIIYKDNKAYYKKVLELEDIFKDTNKIKEDILSDINNEEEKEDLNNNGVFSYKMYDDYIDVTLTGKNAKHTLTLSMEY